MVRILTVTNRYPPHSWGGYELVAAEPAPASDGGTT